MQKTHLAIVLGSVLLASALLTAGLDSDSQVGGEAALEHAEAFTKWMTAHRKVYPTPAEKQFRFEQFVKTLARIEATNSNPTLTFTAGTNEFSDLSAEEFETRFFKAETEDTRGGIRHSNQGPVANDIDWRKEGAVTAVKNQWYCTVGWAFSVSGNLESAWKLAGNNLTTFSEQQLIDCSGQFGNNGCNGGNPFNSYRYLAQYARGLQSDSNYPYFARVGYCMYDPVKVVASVTGYYFLDPQDCGGLLNALNTSPVSVGINAAPLQDYQGGIYNDYGKCGSSVNHYALAVGYGVDDKGSWYWVVKNNWGAGWGEAGYIRFERTFQAKEDGICGLCLAVSYLKVN